MIGRELLKDSYTQADMDCAIAQTRQDTLREVGEWLDTHNLPGMRGKYIYQEDIEQLKRGEMPEQSGTK